MLSQPVLSVITASRDRRDLLLLKLESLRTQSLQPGLFEWLVCLDDSSDDSRLALETELEARPPAFRVRLVDSLVQIGPGPARNRAAELAGGRILYLSDDDCLPDPDCLELHLQAQAQPAVYVGSLTFRDEGRDSRWRPGRVEWWNVNGANTSLPVSTFRQTGGFPDYLEGYGGEDLGLGWQLQQAGLEVRALSAAHAVHLGPATGRGFHPERWQQAGGNAMRLASRHPAMAGRLGVQPWQLAVKRVFAPMLGPRGRLEAAYARGALAQRGKEQE